MPNPASKIYGQLHLVRYNGMEFYLGESKSGLQPEPASLHYLVPPEILVIPEFTLLEETCPKSLDELLEIMEGVAELCQRAVVGVAHNRLAHAGKWGTVGEYAEHWQCDAVLEDPGVRGVYLSPQQMMALSQGQDPAQGDQSKADMFALGIMLLEMVFGESLGEIFDYEHFEIRLKPLLVKLNTLRQEFGDELYAVFLRMLELDEEQRMDFDELLEALSVLKGGQHKRAENTRMETRMESSSYMSNSNSSYSSNYRAPPTTKSPLRKRPTQAYRNDVSPLRGGKFLEKGRTPERGAERSGTGRTPERSNRSPIKRDLRINTRFDKENGQAGNFTTRSPYKPTLLRKNGVSPLSRR